MATGTASRGAAKGSKGSKGKAKSPNKKKAAGTKRGQGSKAQATELARVTAENPQLTADVYAENMKLDPADVGRFRHFALEYLRDFNPVAACIRMGFSGDTAKAPAKLYLSHTYVQLKLREAYALMEQDAVCSNTDIMRRLWEEANAPDVAFSSNAVTRIKALETLAKIRGMFEKQKDEDKTQVVRVMAVPVLIGGGSYPQVAQSSQARLKQLSQAAIEA